MTLDKFQSGESIYDPEFREKLNALVDAANETSAQDNEPEPDSDETRMFYGIPVRLTAHGSTAGFYQFEEVIGGTGNWTAKVGGLTHTDLGEARVRHQFLTLGVRLPVINRVVYLKVSPDVDGSGNRIFEFDAPPIFTPVTLTVTSGSDGIYNQSEPTYTYTATDKDLNILGTGLTPRINRDQAPVAHQADEGLVYFDNSGNAVLLWANEEPDHSRGYYQLEGASPYASGTASEIANPNGKIEFAGRANSGEIAVRSVISDGAGTDTVTQYILESDLPAGAADGQGFEDVHYNGVSQEATTDGGIIDFDDQQTPSADAVVVNWTITGDAAGTATVQGEVDVSGITGDSGTLAGRTFLDVEVRVTDAASASTEFTIHDFNYSGRGIRFIAFALLDDTAANWADYTEVSPTTYDQYIGTTESADVTLAGFGGAGGPQFLIDQSDGYKLKLNTGTRGAPSSGKFDFYRVMVEIGARKTAADVTINT